MFSFTTFLFITVKFYENASYNLYLQYFTASKNYTNYNLENEIKFQISNLFDDLFIII